MITRLGRSAPSAALNSPVFDGFSYEYWKLGSEGSTRLFKHPKLPNNVMVHEFLGLLGKPDAVVIFEAPDASTAADFMVQFSRVTDATTSLALPIEEFKWTW